MMIMGGFGPAIWKRNRALWDEIAEVWPFGLAILQNYVLKTAKKPQFQTERPVLLFQKRRFMCDRNAIFQHAQGLKYPSLFAFWQKYQTKSLTVSPIYVLLLSNTWNTHLVPAVTAQSPNPCHDQVNEPSKNTNKAWHSMCGRGKTKTHLDHGRRRMKERRNLEVDLFICEKSEFKC